MRYYLSNASTNWVSLKGIAEHGFVSINNLNIQFSWGKPFYSTFCFFLKEKANNLPCNLE